MSILAGMVVAALNLALSIWAFRYTLHREPTIQGAAAKVRWCMVAVNLGVAAIGILVWGGSLLGDRITFIGFFLAGVFLIFRSLSLQIVEFWQRTRGPGGP